MGQSTDQIELDAVLNTMVDGVIMITQQGLIARYNAACEEIFGYELDAVIGRNIAMLMPEPYHANHDSYIRNYQHSNVPKIIGIGREVQGKRKDGTVFPMYLSVGETGGDEDRAYVGIIRDLSDVSAQREEYESLQQQHFHLSRVAAMDQMGAAIAHELNQPLTAIMNYMEAGQALLERGNVDPSKMSGLMRKASEQSARAAGILSRLRRFIEKGDVEKEMIAADGVLRSAVDLVMPSFKNDSITVVFETAEDLPPVLASHIQIQQVLVNLIRNSCQAMNDVEDERKILTLSIATLADDNVKIGVIDTGCGMTDSQYNTLYEPFSTTKADGLGVGLSISQSIIASHSGKIWAERVTPRGTAFYFTLPVQS